jgi:DNA-binding CsgD family transcriptional regulator
MFKHRPETLGAMMIIGKELLSSRSLRELGNTAFSYLSQVLDADSCALYPHKNGRFDFQGAVAVGGMSQHADLYVKHYSKIDPLVSEPYTPYPYNVYTTSDVIEDGALERSRFYNEFLKPLSIKTRLCINLRDGSGRSIGSFIAGRNPEARPFGPSDKSLATMLEPYLSAALEKAPLEDQSRDQELVISSLLEGVPGKGVILLDHAFCPVHRNSNSDSILSMFYGRDESRSGLPMVLEMELRTRREEIVNEAEEGCSGPEASTFEVAAPGGREKIKVSVRPCRRPGKLYYLLIFEQKKNELFLSGLAKQYHLTAREIEIISCICKGMRNSLIAKELFISDRTVSNHLCNIFQKMKIRNRATILQMILEQMS